MTLERLLEFEEIFPNETPQPLIDYLKGSSKEMIRGVATFFLSFNNVNTSHTNKKLLKEIFSKENDEIRNFVYSKITNFKRNGIDINIINHYSSLRLFELYYDFVEAEVSQTFEEFEINLFKVYLLLNTEWVKKQDQAINSVEKVKETITEEFGKGAIPIIKVFTTFYPTFDKDNYDIMQSWVSQLYRSILFLKFISNHPKGGKLWSTFLDHNNCDSWQNYLKKLIPITLSAIKFDNERHTTISVVKDEYFEDNCDFIENIILEEYDKDEDFRPLRENPIYKIKRGEYRIIFNLFVVQKLYKGLYFALKNINDSLSKSNKISKNFRQLVTDEFSEQTLCYEVLSNIYPVCDIKIPGRHILELGFIGEPDYYIRYGNNILLFESKDVLVSASKKMSYNYEVYDKEFENKFYYHIDQNGKEVISAVVQLRNNIEKILKKEFSFDEKYDINNINIYPILLTHEMEYDTPGLNVIVNEWFQAEMKELKDENPHLQINRCNPVVIINIESLIFRMDYLSQIVQLHIILKQFFLDNKKMSCYSPIENISFSFYFDTYIKDKFIRRNIHADYKIIKKMIPDLFPDEI